jgi:hypothetical protein
LAELRAARKRVRKMESELEITRRTNKLMKAPSGPKGALQNPERDTFNLVQHYSAGRSERYSTMKVEINLRARTP